MLTSDGVLSITKEPLNYEENIPESMNYEIPLRD